MTLVTWSEDDRYYAGNMFFAKVIDGKRWNGWAMPWFSEGEASRIAEDMATNPGFDDVVRFNAATGHFEVLNEDTDSEDEVWEPVPTMVDSDGVTLHAMLSGSWTWREVNRPDDDDPEAQDEFDAMSRDVERLTLWHADLPEYHYLVVGK